MVPVGLNHRPQDRQETGALCLSESPSCNYAPPLPYIKHYSRVTLFRYNFQMYRGINSHRGLYTALGLIYGKVWRDKTLRSKGMYGMPVPAGRELEPSAFAKAFSSRVRVVMAQQRVTAQALASEIGVSRSYMGKRLRDEASFTLTDVEAISKALGMELPKLPEL